MIENWKPRGERRKLRIREKLENGLRFLAGELHARRQLKRAGKDHLADSDFPPPRKDQ